jgi:hypothetical protein
VEYFLLFDLASQVALGKDLQKLIGCAHDKNGDSWWVCGYCVAMGWLSILCRKYEAKEMTPEDLVKVREVNLILTRMLFSFFFEHGLFRNGWMQMVNTTLNNEWLLLFKTALHRRQSNKLRRVQEVHFELAQSMND